MENVIKDGTAKESKFKIAGFALCVVTCSRIIQWYK
jgi:hypothetical protein